MDEDFLDVTNSGSKAIAFVIIIILVLASIFGYFFVFQKNSFNLKTIELELGTEPSKEVNDYLKKKLSDTSKYLLDISNVNSDEIGTYTYKITHNRITKKGKIYIKDTTPPKFSIKDQEIEQGDENFYLSDFLSSCEDKSLPCIVTFKNENDEDKLNIPGEYSINIVISDVYNNKSEATVNLKVIEKGKFIRNEELDLQYYSSSSDLPNFNNEYYIKFEKAYKEDSEELEDIISEISAESIETYIKNNYPGSSLKEAQIVKSYNKSHYVIGIVVKLTINKGTDTIVYMKNI